MKVTIIVLVALALTSLLRRRSAALRHWILAAAIACAAVTPVLERLVPSWQLPRGPSPIQWMEATTPPAVGSETPRPGVPGPLEQVEQDASASPPLRMVTSGGLLEAVWMTGFGISLFVLLVGLGRLVWLASRARRLAYGRWTDLADEISRECGLRRPVLLLQSDHPSLLVTWGLVRPKIILPAGAAQWPEDLMRIVLCHELAHIRRGDWIVQMAGQLLRSVYWFNPILWIACRRLRLESEHACDDEVLSRGVEGSSYATHLIDLARALNRRRAWVPAPAMARPSSLERRITAMLNDRLNRNRLSRLARVTIVIALLTITIAVAAAQVFATFSGSLADVSGGVLPGAKLILTNTERQAKYEVSSNQYGQFEFVGLPPGDYTFEGQLPGFATFRETLAVAGQNVQRAITLQVGELVETVNVRDGVNSSTASLQPRNPRAMPPRVQAVCNSGGVRNADGSQIGGNIRPPRKIRDAAPQYPQHLQGTGTESVIVMSGRIGLDGFITDLKIQEPAPPDFASAAVSAVSQWQYDSTLLNCDPVEVPMTITVRFIHQP